MGRCIVIIGVSRSGTSAVAGVLHHLGVRMTNVVEEPYYNPKGLFERPELRRFLTYTGGDKNVKLQRTRAMLREFNEDELWGVKELRLTELPLSDVLDGLDDVRLVFVRRSLTAVDQSYSSAGAGVLGVPEPAKQTRRLLEARLDALAAGYPTLEVCYDCLVDSTEREVSKLVRFVFEDMDQPPPEVIAGAVAFVEPKLRHFF